MLDFNLILSLAKRHTDINEYLLSLYWASMQMNAKTIVELGAGQSTYALLVAAIETDGILYSIDVDEEYKAPLRNYPQGKEFLKHKSLIQIAGDDIEVVETWDKEIDFLLIDTSHLYDHTKRELETWPDFVRPGGIIAMHDTAHKKGFKIGCRTALNEWLQDVPKNKYTAIHLLDTKHIGMTFINKIF